MPSVDDIWAQMKADVKPERKPPSSRAGDLGKLSQKSGMATSSTSKVVETAELKETVLNVNSIPGRGVMNASIVAKMSGDDNEDAVQDGLEREIQFMSSSDVSQRRGALSRLLTLANDPECPVAVQRQAFSALHVETIKLLSDNVERVRDQAYRVLLAFFDALDPPSLACSLPLLVPSLVHRIGCLPPSEPSEEVRLLALLVTSRIFTVYGKRMGDYIEALDSICSSCLEDSHPLVRLEAGNLISMMCRTLKAKMQQIVRMEERQQGPVKIYRYGEMVKRLKPSLKHKHAKVRCSAIEALKSLLLCGEKNMDVVEDLVCWQLPNIIPVWHFFDGGVWEEGKLIKPEEREVQRNYLAVLAGDKSPTVRACFLRMMADWMSCLFDRWDHESRLLPYLLNGLTDTVPEIRFEAHACMERLGAVHEDEKENNDRDKQELRDFREYGWKSPAELNAAERWASRPQEPPFTQRPRLGARMVVRNNFKRLVPTLVKELTCWQSETRRMSGQLLYYLTLYTEQWVTSDAHSMLAAYIKSAQSSISLEREGDPEGAVLLRQCLLCSEALGMFTDPALWLPLLLPSVSGNADVDVENRAAHMAVLGALCKGASRSWLAGHSPQIIQALAEGESSSPLVCAMAANTARHLAATCSSMPAELKQHLASTIVSLQARAWEGGARTLPPPEEDDESMENSVWTRMLVRGKDWKGVQAACWEALDALSEGQGASSIVSQQQPGDTLPSLEVILRQAEVSDMPKEHIASSLRTLCRVISCGGAPSGEALALATLVSSQVGVEGEWVGAFASLLGASLECAARASKAARGDGEAGGEGGSSKDASAGEGAGAGAGRGGPGSPGTHEDEGFVVLGDVPASAGTDNTEMWGPRGAESALEVACAALGCAYVLLSADGWTPATGEDDDDVGKLLEDAVLASVALPTPEARQLACALAQCGAERLAGGGKGVVVMPAGKLAVAVGSAMADPHESVREAACGAMPPLIAALSKGDVDLGMAMENARTMVSEGEGGDDAQQVVRLLEALHV